MGPAPEVQGVSDRTAMGAVASAGWEQEEDGERSVPRPQNPGQPVTVSGAGRGAVGRGGEGEQCRGGAWRDWARRSRGHSWLQASFTHVQSLPPWPPWLPASPPCLLGRWARTCSFRGRG